MRTQENAGISLCPCKLKVGVSIGSAVSYSQIPAGVPPRLPETCAAFLRVGAGGRGLATPASWNGY